MLHAQFLKRNATAIAATLERALDQTPPQDLPLLEQLTVLVATGRPIEYLPSRTGKAFRRVFNSSGADERAGWSKGGWSRAIGHLKPVLPEAPARLHRLHHRLSERGDYPQLEALRRWGQPRWRELLREAGCPADLAGTATALLLDRREMPGGPWLRPVYERVGFPTGPEGRPGRRDIFPEDVDRLKRVLPLFATTTCTPDKPPQRAQCKACPINKFCTTYRSGYRRRLAHDQPTFIDLFAGGGGLSLGLTMAGYEMKSAVEMDEHAGDTLYLNHPEATAGNIELRDINELLSDRDFIERYRNVDVVCGGPPCQPFSMARRHSGADRNDPRRTLFSAFVELAQSLQPQAVIMENVPGILNAAAGKTRQSIYDAFDAAGFTVVHKLLNAADFGVPQNRNRVFFVGINRVVHPAPDPILERFTEGLDSLRQEKPVKLTEALSGLHKLRAGEGSLVLRSGPRGRRSAYAKECGSPTKFVYNHEARSHNPRDIRIFAALREGETAAELVRRRPKMKIPYQLESFGDKYRRLHHKRPSPTIPAHLHRDANSFVHPSLPRGITPREAARFQSFPDDYVFLGGFGPSFIQIGNAVPPKLAMAVGSALKAALHGEPQRPS